MASHRTRAALSWLMTLGPAAGWVAFALWHYGPTRGWRPVLELALFVAVGLVGLAAVVVAWLPWTLERLGLVRLAAWLRTWWDEDAR